MYPRRKDKFVQWSKAMVEGATIDKPHYPGTKDPKANKARAQPQRQQRRRRRKRKHPDG